MVGRAFSFIRRLLGVEGGAILTGPEIKRQVEAGTIVIEPFEPDNVGPNSVDLHLGHELFRYDCSPFANGRPISAPLDPKILPPIVAVETQSDGRWLLVPGRVYLGSTLEYTETVGFVPVIDGRSSLGRLGVFAHVTAGRGDDGFKGRWTVELAVIEPILLEPYGRYFQLTYHRVYGTRQPYKGRYQGDLGPVASRISSPRPR